MSYEVERRAAPQVASECHPGWKERCEQLWLIRYMFDHYNRQGFPQDCVLWDAAIDLVNTFDFYADAYSHDTSWAHMVKDKSRIPPSENVHLAGLLRSVFVDYFPACQMRDLLEASRVFEKADDICRRIDNIERKYAFIGYYRKGRQ